MKLRVCSAEATWNVLARLGCDTVQGYFSSRPLPMELFDGWVTQNGRSRESVRPA